MRQFHRVRILISKKKLDETQHILVEQPKGYETEIEIVDNLPERYENGIRVEGDHTVVLVPSDLAELEKPDERGRQSILNRFGGQTTIVKLIQPKRDNNKAKKNPKKTDK